MSELNRPAGHRVGVRELDVVWKNQAMSKTIEMKGREKQASIFQEKRKTTRKYCEVGKEPGACEKSEDGSCSGTEEESSIR